MMNYEGGHFFIRRSMFLVRYSKIVPLFVYNTLQLIDHAFRQPFL